MIPCIYSVSPGIQFFFLHPLVTTALIFLIPLILLISKFGTLIQARICLCCEMHSSPGIAWQSVHCSYSSMAFSTDCRTFFTVAWWWSTRWCLETLTPTIPPGSPKQGMIWQRPEGRPSMGRSTVRSLPMQTKIFLLASSPSASPTRLPSQRQPSSPDITLLSWHLRPDVTWSTLTTST